MCRVTSLKKEENRLFWLHVVDTEQKKRQQLGNLLTNTCLLDEKRDEKQTTHFDVTVLKIKTIFAYFELWLESYSIYNPVGGCITVWNALTNQMQID